MAYLHDVGEHTCGSHAGTGTGTAGHCNSASSFPDTHFECVVVENLYEFRVDSFGEVFAVFKHRTDRFNVHLVNAVAEYYAVRISDGNARDIVFLAADLDGFVITDDDMQLLNSLKFDI